MNFRDSFRDIRLKNFIFLTLAGIINAFGVVMFLSPVKLYDSGISGTSMLISQIGPEWCTLSFCLVALNIPVFLFGLKLQGASFTVYSIYAVAVYSLCAWIITDVLPVDVSFVSPLAGRDLFLCAIFGGIISGLGSGIAIRFGGAMDGIDIMAVIFAKRLGISIGTFVMIFNIILYSVCGIILNSWILPLYSIVTYFAALKTVDFCVDGFDRSKAAFIVTTMPEQVCAALSDAFDNGITMIESRGYYSRSKKTTLFYVLNHFQISRMRDIVHRVDPKAYISLCEVSDLFPANKDE